MEGALTVPAREKESNPATIQCPMLTTTNYTVWTMRMKVALRCHKVWDVIEPGSSNEDKNNLAIALLFQSIPERLILQIGDHDRAKDVWDAIKSRYLGADRVREARLQTLSSEFEKLTMKESENIEDFAGRISSIAARSTALGQNIEEHKMVKKFLNGLPRNKFIQLVASLEQVLDLNKTGFEDIVGRLKAYEERIGDDGQGSDQGKLLFTSSDTQNSREGSDGSKGRGRGNRGRGRGRGRGGSNSQTNKRTDQNQGKPKKDRSNIICWRCDKPGHFVSTCPEKRRGQEANLVETEEADAALYKHEVVFLNEKNIMPRKYEEEKDEQSIWYLDNGASNHMTGNRSYFSEMNENIKGKVKFGDDSCVDIKGKAQ